MRQIGNVIISDEAWDARFACDLSRCLGKCCQYGDLGAPVTREEADTIAGYLDRVKPVLCKQHINFLKAGIAEEYHGKLHIREIGADHPCPLSFFDSKGTVLCSLHNYTLENNIPLLKVKPLWCSLFPVILTRCEDLWMLNCYFPDICRSVKDAPPLIISFGSLLAEVFGQDWLDQVKAEYKKEGIKA